MGKCNLKKDTIVYYRTAIYYRKITTNNKQQYVI